MTGLGPPSTFSAQQGKQVADARVKPGRNILAHAEKIPLADLDAVMAQDAVGDGGALPVSRAQPLAAKSQASWIWRANASMSG